MLWNEFQAIRQMLNGRTLPIQDIANKIKQYQIQLPRISNWQCYHQLLEAMDTPLLQAVRVRKIRDWPTPSNIKELKSFLGIINYCSQFALHLATISSPLTAIAGCTVNWDWTHAHQQSFELIKQTLSAGPAVRLLDYESTEPIFLVTDASLIGTGA